MYGCAIIVSAKCYSINILFVIHYITSAKHKILWWLRDYTEDSDRSVHFLTKNPQTPMK